MSCQMKVMRRIKHESVESRYYRRLILHISMKNGNVGYLQFFTPKSLLLSVHHKVHVVRKRCTYGENIDSIKSKDWESSPFATQIEDNIEKYKGSKECLRRQRTHSIPKRRFLTAFVLSDRIGSYSPLFLQH